MAAEREMKEGGKKKERERNRVRKRIARRRVRKGGVSWEDLLLGERISTGSCMSFFRSVEIYGLLKLLPRRKHICF